MERYCQLFALHGISIDVLPLLTDTQLVEMGITAEDDRRKILTAVEKIQDGNAWRSPPPAEDDTRSTAIKNGSGSAAKSPPSDTRTVEELLDFINSGSAENKKNRKKKSSNNKTKRRKSGPSTRGLSPSRSNVKPKKASAKTNKTPNSEKHDTGISTTGDEALDPELKAQVDREVDEFRRRLEAASAHNTKGIFLLFLDLY